MNKFLILILTTLIPMSIFAHNLVLNIFDNEDNTITIEGGFNTGESAAGAFIRLESKESGEVLFKQRLSDESEITVKIPNQAYNIILDGGPGHEVVKDGLAPIGGFTKKETKNEEVKKDKSEKRNMQVSTSKAVTISIIVAFLLLFATILISIRNTNKLMRELNTKK